MELHFIGTVHFDSFGKERLLKALRSERPDIVTVEATPKHVEYITGGKLLSLYHDHVERLKALGLTKKEGVRAFESSVLELMHYEAQAVIEYAAEVGIPVVPIDDPGEFSRSLQKLRDNENRAYVSILNGGYDSLRRMLGMNAESSYRSAQHLLRQGALPKEIEFLDAIREDFFLPHLPLIHRDEYPHTKLREFAHAPSLKVVHVCGFAHAFRSGPRKFTLWDKVEDLQPQRRLLSSYM